MSAVQSLKFNKKDNLTTINIINPININELANAFVNHLLELDIINHTLNENLNIGEIKILSNDDYYIMSYKCESNRFICLLDREKNIIGKLNINNNNHWILTYKNKYIDSSNETTKEMNDIAIDFINTLYKYDNQNIFNDTYFYHTLGIYDEENSKVIFGSKDILLILPKFYKENPEWMRLYIIDKNTFNNVGTIEFNLNNKGKDNYSFSGNVFCEIKEKYKCSDYALKALILLKDYIMTCSNEYNKDLFISTDIDNTDYQNIILNSGGTLYYEGSVPKGDRLRIYEKKESVKIYKLNSNRKVEMQKIS